MEVGILTFSRVHNYGAILQCYALYESLKNLGHNVKIIESTFISKIYKTI